MNRRTAILASIAATFLPRLVSAAPAHLINGVDVTTDQFESTLIAESQKDGGRVTIFYIGASWCPACSVLPSRLDAAISAVGRDTEINWVRTDVSFISHTSHFAPEMVKFLKKWGNPGASGENVQFPLPHVGVYFRGKLVPESTFVGAPSGSDLILWLRGIVEATQNGHRPAIRFELQPDSPHN